MRMAAALVAWLPLAAASNCSLADGPSLRLASRIAAATAGCDVVAYTTLVYPAGVRFPHPSTRLGPGAANGTAGVCYVLVAGAASAASLREHCDVAPWRVVALDADAAGRGDRRASRRVKLLPLEFFANARYLLFVDWKLVLKQHPLDLVRSALGGGFGFAAFRHPCTAAYTRPRVSPCSARRPGEAWWRTEARLVEAKTADVAALRAQVARYETAGGLGYYADGAVLLWDAHHPVAATLSCAWWAEYDRDDSSDRDQLAFARAVTAVLPPPASEGALFAASTKAEGVFLISEGGGATCGDLCHQYERGSRTVASAGARRAGRAARRRARDDATLSRLLGRGRRREKPSSSKRSSA
ncbi:GTPase [Aureococcus anophagefferens]|nr:GTPase [Aureococcus anophagefferens]